MRRMLPKAFALALLFSLALFSQELFLKSVEWGSHKFIAKRLGSTFSFDTLAWKEGALVVSGGRLEGAVEGSFSVASWKPAFSLRRCEIGGKVVVEDLDLCQKRWNSSSGQKRKRRSLIRTDFDLQIPQAHLQLADVELMLDVARQDQQLTLSSDLSGQNLCDLYRMVCQIWQLPEPYSDWDVTGGELRGELLIAFSKGQLYNLVGQIDATKIEMENSLFAVCGQWERLHIDFDLDMSSSLKVDTWDGTFSLVGGRIALLPDTLDFWDGMWDLSKLHSMVSVKNGKVDSSFLRGTFFGMEGEIDLDWYSHETLMSLAFACNSQEMIPLLPKQIRGGFERGFPDDHFAINATLKRQSEGLLLEGILQAADHELDFGCHFGQEAKRNISLPPLDTFADKLKEQFCLSDKRLGWIRGEQIPLEKFMAPFVLPDEEMELSGVVNFEGTFDERYLVLYYEGEDFHLEGQSFDMKIARVDEEVSNNTVAVHYVDLKTGDHEGLLPISYGQYTHKSRGVVFEPVMALAHIHNNRIEMKQLESSWSGLNLYGEVTIVMDDFSNIDVDLQLFNSGGPIADAFELCNCFYKLPYKQPLEGSFEMGNQGMRLRYYENRLQDVQMQARCLASSALFGMAIEEADFLFTYDRKSKTISFADGSFNLFYDQQSYPLSFEKLRFSPGNWELEAQDLHGSIVQGQIAIDGLVQASGFWDDNHIKLDHIAWGDWLGDLEIEGSLLHHFQVSNKQSELFVSGDWKNRQFLVERVALDLATILPHSMDQWKPTGLFEGSGQIYYDGELQGEIIATFRDLHFGGISFGDGEHLLCQLNQTSGVSIEGLEAQVGGSSYKLGGFHYNYREEKLHFDGFDFTIPAHRLESVVDVASELFPGKIHGSIRRHLVALKDDEEFAGRVNIELFPNTVWIQLSLNDGCYTLFDQQVDLRSFTLSYDPLELLIKTEARYQDSYYWLRFLTQTPTLNEGVLAIYEHEDEELCIYWDPGWEVCKIEGEAAGCCANLAATNSQERLDLEGSLAIESDRIVPLLSGRLHQMLQNISIEGGYELDGQWYFSKEDPFNPEFYGTIEGRNFGVYNVACNSFCSDLTYCNDQLTMHDFKVIDWSGTLSVRELLLNRAGDFSVEEVKVENFRLSRLNSPWTDMEKRERPLFRSFCVPQFILTNLQGQIKDPASYTGEGSLYFTNYAKKTLFSNLMQLPTEISARLGLDLTNLIPVRGQLIYTIEDGLVKVTEMRDVYSEGKRARFFLADDEPAYLDFEGNIDVKIRMKQYTLLMKIAELFTFSVKGTIFNPLYTVTNHD